MFFQDLMKCFVNMIVNEPYKQFLVYVVTLECASFMILLPYLKYHMCGYLYKSESASLIGRRGTKPPT